MSARPVRVLELVSGLAIEGISGGAARFVTELVQAIDRKRVQPSVAAIWYYKTPYEQPRAAQLSAAGIPTMMAAVWDEDREYRSCVAGLVGLRRMLSQPFDVVHSHGEFSDLAAIAVRHKVGARGLVRTVHSEIEWGKRPLWGKLFPNLLYPWYFTAELAVSQQAADNLDRRPLARLRGRKAPCVPNGLNFTRFSDVHVDRPEKRRALGVPMDRLVVGSVGRLVRAKGYDVLLAAAPQVLAHCPNVHFVLVGAGSEGETLPEQARTLGIADRVTFTGARPDVVEVLKTFDLFVSSSRWEGLATVLLEAIAAGLPIVATDISGNRELIEHNFSGLLVPPEDPAALANAIVAVATEQARASMMAEHACARAKASYSIDAVAARYADLYCELIRLPGTAVAQ